MIFSTGKNHMENTGLKGSYLLVLRLRSHQRITVGSLGRIGFPPGYYIYGGSAQGPGGLRARLERHIKPDKPLRWHIDYLRRRAEVHGIWTAAGARNLEHRWAGLMKGAEGASVPAPGFGASDCRCAAHLFHFSRPPEASGLFTRFPGPVIRGSPGGPSDWAG
jgi:Uri superfamily endonuclease